MKKIFSPTVAWFFTAHHSASVAGGYPFILAIFLFLIPSMERQLMDQKKGDNPGAISGRLECSG